MKGLFSSCFAYSLMVHQVKSYNKEQGRNSFETLIICLFYQMILRTIRTISVVAFGTLLNKLEFEL
jgi:hypothetical protein